MLDFGFYNADCMDLMKEFPDQYFDLAIVDPVYGGVTPGGYMKNGFAGDNFKNKPYHIALWRQDKTDKSYFDELFRVSKNQIIWGGNYFASMLHDTQCWIVWDKQRSVNYADFEIAWTSFDQASRIFRYKWNGFMQGDMKNKEKRIHPTQKSVVLYEWLLNMFAGPDDIMLDTHVGSASSLIACRNTNHKYVGSEIDPVYYAAAKKRLDAEEAQMNIFDFE